MLFFTVSLRTPRHHHFSIPKCSLCHPVMNRFRKLWFTSYHSLKRLCYTKLVYYQWKTVLDYVFHKVKFPDAFAWMHPTKTFPFLASLLKKHKPNLIHDAQQSAWGVLLWIASTSGTAAKIKWTKGIRRHPCLYYVLKLRELNPSCEQGLLSHSPLPLTYSV